MIDRRTVRGRDIRPNAALKKRYERKLVDMVEAMHREDRIPVVQEICVATYGLRTHCVNVWEAISAHACKSKTNGIWRFDPCGDCRVYGTWKRDRDEYIVFVGSSGIFCRDCYS